MKKTRLLFSLIALILLLSLTLTSCALPTGGKADEGGDGGKNDEEVGNTTSQKDPSKLYLVEDGFSNFHFVYSNDLSSSTRNYLFSRIAGLESMDISANAVRDDFDYAIEACEVLVGTFRGREEYEVSKYILGNKGYTIRVKDDKVIILGGTEESLRVAFDVFISQYMVYDVGTKNITLDRELDKTVREVYDITSMSIGGTELSAGDFKFVCDPADTAALKAAELMRIRLYDSAGYYLDIVEESDGHGIYITSTERSAADGFMAYLDDGSLRIECQYPPLFESEMAKYLAALVSESASGDIDIGGEYSRHMHTVSYLEFGAVGDGVTDDFEAIKAAHECANEYGLSVDACGDRKDEGLVFNVGAHAETVYIKTDVDWTGASFIVDDSSILPSGKVFVTNIFTVSTSLSVADNIKGTVTSLPKSATNIGVPLSQNYLAVIFNSNTKQYIRYGSNADSGAAQQEVILLNKNGDIDQSTPLLWNYTTVTDVKLYPADDAPITIKGGTFTTIANQAPREYTYYSRGISIQRSNVTVEGLTHLITGEGDTGAPYNGFLSVSNANNILFEDIVYTAHKTYKLSSNANNSMGTYDISAGTANAITWKNCTQTNSITDKTYWGIMGSNYCKNLTYDGCTLSRFDAHKGMYNSTIVDSEIGHAGITAIGAGYLRIENTVVNTNNVVHLRTDYGSTWDGEIIIKDVTLKNSTSTATLIDGSWNDHYFGYVCHLPNVTVDNVTVARGTSVTVFSSFSGKDITATSTKNPVVTGDFITIKNNKNGYSFTVSSNNYLKGAYKLITQ